MLSLFLLLFLLLLVIGNGLVVAASDVDFGCGDLILKEVEILLGGGDADLSVLQVALEKGEGFVMIVLDHHVGSEPKADLTGVVGDGCLGPDIVGDEEVGLHLLLLVVFVLQHADDFEGLADVRSLHSEGLAATGQLLLHELVLLIQFIHVSDKLIASVLFNPSLSVVDENCLGDFAWVVGALGERDKLCGRHLIVFIFKVTRS